MAPLFRALCLISSALLACGNGQSSLSNGRSSEDVFGNGESLNGESLNGESLNGESLNGESLNGTPLGSSVTAVSFSGVQLNGNVLDSTSLNGTVFSGTGGGTTFSGYAFRRAIFNATTDSGAIISLRIQGISQEAPPNDDVWDYWLTWSADGGDNWQPFCVNASGNTVPAIPVNGIWDHRRGVPGGGAKIDDPSSFTFACKGMGAVAKCVFPIGYKPWKTVNGVSLDRWHQACVRLIRADFCGDGTPYTVNGQRVNLYDGIGVQQDTRYWLIEAEWDENGARCFNPVNRSHWFVPCFNDRALAVCGAPFDFQRGPDSCDPRLGLFGCTLLMDETPIPLLQGGPLLVFP
ncbi:MAG: hypothetical protein E6J78_00375 [Deltaproteobacteria bacterium]|nr:MAG: hypothetical protein E6J78_00375 [Deltaproteobacteria bacterium]